MRFVGLVLAVNPRDPRVLDTNVLISALLFSDLPSRLVTAWQSVQFQPVVSRSILDEYLRALAYPKFHLAINEIRVLMEEAFLPFVESVTVKGVSIQLDRDPDDAKFIECARACHVPWIISGDSDLLDLCQVESVKIVTVKEFLGQLKGRKS
ncbi:MAG: putative toxin-antitoxin system toxin component, PIN family [Nitrospirales bacterium]|nr:putative toxin-antitoxin system toxin component, PIN family [Nitrospirales bacterium]